ncbi:hypothetical protein GCM10028862_18190 [Luteimonas pelagia]
MRHALLTSAITCLAGAVLVSGEASALTSRTLHLAATSVCQPATPLQLGGLRYRPLGIYNNKPESIYVSCSLQTEFHGDVATNEIRIYFANTTAAPVEVTCTAQGGSRVAGFTNYPGSVNVAAGATTGLVFTGIDKVSKSNTHLNISCLLPSGIEMGTIQWVQNSLTDDL